LALNIPDYKLFFKGETFKDKMHDYYEKDEADDEFFLKVIGKVSAIISYWYFSGTEFSKEDVDAFLQDNDEVAEEIVNDEQPKAEPAAEE
jgi:hypothetical protein